MKNEELKYERLGEANCAYPASTLVIRKQFVDEAIAELKEKLAEEREFGVNRAKAADHDIGKLCVEVSYLNKQLRATKRALWLARKAHAVAMFAFWDSHYRDNPNAVYRNRTVDWLRNRWLLILDAIIKKEKEYK